MPRSIVPTLPGVLMAGGLLTALVAIALNVRALGIAGLLLFAFAWTVTELRRR